MILADASVWIDHLRKSEPDLARALGHRRVYLHPFVRGEIALGRLQNRDATLEELREIPQPIVSSVPEVEELIELHGLHGRGIGYVDAHLLASTLLTPDTTLWTRDKRLRAAAEELGCAEVLD